MGLLESPIKNTNKPYQWISTQGEKFSGLVEICCKHTLLNAQMACLKMSFTENDVADLTGSSLSPDTTTQFVLPWVLCWFLHLYTNLAKFSAIPSTGFYCTGSLEVQFCFLESSKYKTSWWEVSAISLPPEKRILWKIQYKRDSWFFFFNFFFPPQDQ